MYKCKFLVISDSDDPHIKMVQSHLNDPLCIFDPSKFPDNTNITYSFENGRFKIQSENRDFSNVISIWYRKPRYLTIHQMPVKKIFRKFARDAYIYTVKALYDLLSDKFWLSDFRSIMKANNKLYQLEMAYQVGFQVPDTIVTSDPQEAIRFLERVGYVITKSLSFTPVPIEDQVAVFFTTRINRESELDFSGLSIAPAIFQKEIRNKIDLRVTVVGEKCFPCLITPNGKSAQAVDWRVGIEEEELNYQVFAEFPLDIQNKCVKLVRKLGLSFGAIDLTIDEYGEYWFLEINPNGQWGFIEIETGMSISSAIAELLKQEKRI